MAAGTDANIKEGAAPHLRPGEQVLATLVASVRGHQQAVAGGIAGVLGGERQRKARAEAEALGITLASPMALVLTRERLLTFSTGGRGRTKELLDEFALAHVGAMEVKRLGLGGAVTLVLRGTAVRLEARVGDSRQFADVLERTRKG